MSLCEYQFVVWWLSRAAGCFRREKTRNQFIVVRRRFSLIVRGAGLKTNQCAGRPVWRRRSAVNAAAVAVSAGSISTETPEAVSLPNVNDVRRPFSRSVGRCPRGEYRAAAATDGRGPCVTPTLPTTTRNDVACVAVPPPTSSKSYLRDN